MQIWSIEEFRSDVLLWNLKICGIYNLTQEAVIRPYKKAPGRDNVGIYDVIAEGKGWLTQLLASLLFHVTIVFEQ